MKTATKYLHILGDMIFKYIISGIFYRIFSGCSGTWLAKNSECETANEEEGSAV